MPSPIPRDTLHEVLSAFPEAGRSLRVLGGGSGLGPAMARVRTDRGLFLVRGDPRALRPEGRLRADHALARHLASRGLPTPVPLRTREGDTVWARGDAVYTVWPAAPGRDLYRDGEAGEEALPSRTARSLGAALARLHEAARDFPGPPAKPPLGPTTGLRILSAPSVPDGVRALRPSDASGPDRLLAHPLGAAVAARLETLRPRLAPLLPRLPGGALHGDFHRSNALYDRRGEVASVIDLDLSFRGPWAFDLARLLDDALFTWWRVLRGAPPRMELARPVLEGYGERRPLTAEEREALAPLLVGWRADALLAAALAEWEARPDLPTPSALARLDAVLRFFDSPTGREVLEGLRG